MRAPRVHILRLEGVIGSGGRFQKGLSLEALDGAIEDAFDGKRLKAVALVINSPGGSPAQSALIHDRVRALADENDIPVVAFVEDVAASGGYWIACAADEIYAQAASIVGSIGVVSGGAVLSGRSPSLASSGGSTPRVTTKACYIPFFPNRTMRSNGLRGFRPSCIRCSSTM